MTPSYHFTHTSHFASQIMRAGRVPAPCPAASSTSNYAELTQPRSTTFAYRGDKMSKRRKRQDQRMKWIPGQCRWHEPYATSSAIAPAIPSIAAQRMDASKGIGLSLKITYFLLCQLCKVLICVLFLVFLMPFFQLHVSKMSLFTLQVFFYNFLTFVMPFYKIIL